MKSYAAHRIKLTIKIGLGIVQPVTAASAGGRIQLLTVTQLQCGVQCNRH